MANPKTQLKLMQISGSLSESASKVSHAHQIADTSLQGLLNSVVTSLKDIQGAGFYNSTIATLKDDDGNARIAYVKDAAFKVKSEDGTVDALQVGSTGADATVKAADNVRLASDSAVLSLGAGDDATLTHDGTTGLIIAATPISIDSTGILDLNSTTGDINFQDGGVNQLALDLDGTNGEVIMKLMVDSDDFVFKQFDGTEVFRVEDNGDFDIAGGLGGSGVTVSAAGAISADGRIITDDATNATSTTDGSIQTDGGLSVALDAVIGDDLFLLSDSAVLNLGLGSDVKITHDGSTGGTLSAAGKMDITAGAASTFKASAGNLTVQADAAKLILSGASGADSVHVLSDMTVNGATLLTGAVTISGGLDVNGTVTTVDTANLLVEDELIVLNRANTEAPAKDQGIVFQRGNGSAINIANKALIWDESDDVFAFADTNDEDGTTAGNVDIDGYAGLRVGALQATGLDLSEGNITNGGDINADRLSIDDAAQGLKVDATGADNGTFEIIMEDGDADALSVKDSGGNDFLVVSTDAGEKIATKKLLDVGAHVNFSVAGENSLSIPDAQADALTIKENTNFYMKFNTSNGSEEVSIHQNLNLSDKNITNVGDINADSISVDDAAEGLTIDFSAANTTKSKILLRDNMAEALTIDEGSNSYLKMITTDGGERVDILKLLRLTGNVDFATAGENSLSIPDGQSDALTIKESGNFYMKFDTTNSAEQVEMHKLLDIGASVNFSVAGENSMSIPDNQSDALTIKEDTNFYMKFVTSNTAERVQLLQQTEFRGNGNSAKGKISLFDLDDSANVTLQSHDVSATYTLTLPAAAPTANQMLRSDGSGNLTFVDSVDGGRASKIVAPVSASITAAQMASANQGFTINASLNHDEGAGGDEKLDMFVNGQLLTSGTSAANGDYKIHGLTADQGGPDGAVFFFDLEAGDIITAVTYS